MNCFSWSDEKKSFGIETNTTKKQDEKLAKKLVEQRQIDRMRRENEKGTINKI